MGTWLVFRASYSNELSGVMVKDTIKPARFCQAGFMFVRSQLLNCTLGVLGIKSKNQSQKTK
jgi:hypothetical protein